MTAPSYQALPPMTSIAFLRRVTKSRYFRCLVFRMEKLRSFFGGHPSTSISITSPWHGDGKVGSGPGSGYSITLAYVRLPNPWRLIRGETSALSFGETVSERGIRGGKLSETPDFIAKLEPTGGFEPPTCGLRNRCSTTELRWHSRRTTE